MTRIPRPRTNTRRTLPDANARPVSGSPAAIERYLERRRAAGRILIGAQIVLGVGAVLVLAWYLLRPGAPGPAALRYLVVGFGLLALLWAMRALPALALLTNARVVIVRHVDREQNADFAIVEMAGIGLDDVRRRGPVRCLPQLARHIEPDDNVLIQPTHDGWQVVAMPGAWADDILKA